MKPRNDLKMLKNSKISIEAFREIIRSNVHRGAIPARLLPDVEALCLSYYSDGGYVRLRKFNRDCRLAKSLKRKFGKKHSCRNKSVVWSDMEQYNLDMFMGASVAMNVLHSIMLCEAQQQQQAPLSSFNVKQHPPSYEYNHCLNSIQNNNVGMKIERIQECNKMTSTHPKTSTTMDNHDRGLAAIHHQHDSLNAINNTNNLFPPGIPAGIKLDKTIQQECVKKEVCSSSIALQSYIEGNHHSLTGIQDLTNLAGDDDLQPKNRHYKNQQLQANGSVNIYSGNNLCPLLYRAVDSSSVNNLKAGGKEHCNDGETHHFRDKNNNIGVESIEELSSNDNSFRNIYHHDRQVQKTLSSKAKAISPYKMQEETAISLHHNCDPSSNNHNNHYLAPGTSDSGSNGPTKRLSNNPNLYTREMDVYDDHSNNSRDNDQISTSGGGTNGRYHNIRDSHHHTTGSNSHQHADDDLRNDHHNRGDHHEVSCVRSKLGGQGQGRPSSRDDVRSAICSTQDSRADSATRSLRNASPSAIRDASGSVGAGLEDEFYGNDIPLPPTLQGQSPPLSRGDLNIGNNNHSNNKNGGNGLRSHIDFGGPMSIKERSPTIRELSLNDSFESFVKLIYRKYNIVKHNKIDQQLETHQAKIRKNPAAFRQLNSITKSILSRGCYVEEDMFRDNYRRLFMAILNNWIPEYRPSEEEILSLECITPTQPRNSHTWGSAFWLPKDRLIIMKRWDTRFEKVLGDLEKELIAICKAEIDHKILLMNLDTQVPMITMSLCEFYWNKQKQQIVVLDHVPVNIPLPINPLKYHVQWDDIVEQAARARIMTRRWLPWLPWQDRTTKRSSTASSSLRGSGNDTFSGKIYN